MLLRTNSRSSQAGPSKLDRTGQVPTEDAHYTHELSSYSSSADPSAANPSQREHLRGPQSRPATMATAGRTSREVTPPQSGQEIILWPIAHDTALRVYRSARWTDITDTVRALLCECPAALSECTFRHIRSMPYTKQPNVLFGSSRHIQTCCSSNCARCCRRSSSSRGGKACQKSGCPRRRFWETSIVEGWYAILTTNAFSFAAAITTLTSVSSCRRRSAPQIYISAGPLALLRTFFLRRIIAQHIHEPA